mgnify:CR=1 FL=1
MKGVQFDRSRKIYDRHTSLLKCRPRKSWPMVGYPVKWHAKQRLVGCLLWVLATFDNGSCENKAAISDFELCPNCMLSCEYQPIQVAEVQCD